MSLAVSELPIHARSYGGDEHGLVYGYLFRPESEPLPLASAEAALVALAAIARGRAAQDEAGAVVWLHFNLGNARAEAWLRAHAALNEDFFDALHQGSRATRIERDGEAFFAVINDVTFDFTFEVSDVATLWMSVAEHLVITARRQPLRSVDRLKNSIGRHVRIESSTALLHHLLRDQADELQKIIRQSTERIDDIEEEMITGVHGKHKAELARMRRLMVRLRRLLTPEPGALARTLARPPAWVGREDRDDLLQASDEFSLVLRDISSLQERIKLMQDEDSAKVAEENNRTLFVLTMVTVLALPINIVAGLLGMNVGGIPLAEHPHGFWVVVGVITLCTVALALYATHRIRSPQGR